MTEQTVMRRAVSSTMWTALENAAPAVIFVATSPWLIHEIGRDRFGVLAVFTTLLVFAVTLDGGVAASLTQFMGVARGAGRGAEVRRTMASGVVLAVVATIAIAVVAMTAWSHIVSHLNAPDDVRQAAASLAPYFVACIGFQLIGRVFHSGLISHEQFATSAVISVVGAVGYLVALLALTPTYGLRGAIFATVIRLAMTMVGWTVVAVRRIGAPTAGLLDRAATKRLLTYALKIQVGGMAMLINAEADTLIVAAILPVRDAAYFALGTSVATAVRMVPQWAIPPLMSRLSVDTGRAGRAVAVQTFTRVQKLWAPGVLAYGAVVAATLGPAITVWLGQGQTEVITIAAILSAGYLVNLLIAPLATLARATGHPGLESRYGIVSLVINLAITIPAALAFGAAGVAAGTAIGCLVGTAYFALLMRPIVERPAAATVLPHSPVWATATVTAVTAVAVGALVWTSEANTSSTLSPLADLLSVLGCSAAAAFATARLTGLVQPQRPVTTGASS